MRAVRDRPETAPEHYVNFELSANRYDAGRDCPADNSVIAQVQKDARLIADPQLAKPLRAEARVSRSTSWATCISHCFAPTIMIVAEMRSAC